MTDHSLVFASALWSQFCQDSDFLGPDEQTADNERDVFMRSFEKVLARYGYCFPERLSSWVSVEEAMPERGESVALRLRNGHWMKGIRFDEWFRDSGPFLAYPDEQVTHWMRLPEEVE